MGFYGTSEEKFKDKWAIVSTSAHNLSMLYKLNRHLKPSNSWKFWKPYKETLWGVGRRIGESRNPFKWGKSQKKCKDHLHKVESRDFLRFQSRLFFFQIYFTFCGIGYRTAWVSHTDFHASDCLRIIFRLPSPYCRYGIDGFPYFF